MNSTLALGRLAGAVGPAAQFCWLFTVALFIFDDRKFPLECHER